VARLPYELKSAGAAFRSSLAQVLQDFGYKSSKTADVRGLRSLGQSESDEVNRTILTNGAGYNLFYPIKEKSEQGLRSLRLRGLRSLGQPDICLRRATKDDGFKYYDDGFEYYEILFVYVNDILTLITAQTTADSNNEGSMKGVSNRRTFTRRSYFKKWN
jgi:hypothetical protein